MIIRNCTLIGSNLASVTDLKKIQTPYSLYYNFRAFTTRWSGGRVQVWVQVWAPAGHQAITSKVVPADNQRYRGKYQRPSSLGSSVALLGLIGRASTNTRCFQVLGSRCWPRLACLRKTCYHSCNTDSVGEAKRFSCFVDIGQLQK